VVFELQSKESRLGFHFLERAFQTSRARCARNRALVFLRRNSWVMYQAYKKERRTKRLRVMQHKPTLDLLTTLIV
jgi:hypothetical protein